MPQQPDSAAPGNHRSVDPRARGGDAQAVQRVEGRDLSTAWRLGIVAVLILFSGWIASEAWSHIWLLIRLDEQSSHGLIVPLAVFLIVSARRTRLRGLRFESHWLGSVATLCGVLLWGVGYHYDIESFWHGGAVLMALGCFVTLTGVEPIRRFAPAYVALIFLIPTPAALRTPITIPLQEITATITQQTCDFLGMGVSQAGRTLRINGQDVTVAEACSGMRMVFTLFLACFLSVYCLPIREPVRWAVLLATPLIAVVANVIRLVPTLWAYGRFDPETADHLHTISGWVMVVAAFFVIEAGIKAMHALGLPVYKRTAAGQGAI